MFFASRTCPSTLAMTWPSRVVSMAGEPCCTRLCYLAPRRLWICWPMWHKEQVCNCWKEEEGGQGKEEIHEKMSPLLFTFLVAPQPLMSSGPSVHFFMEEYFHLFHPPTFLLVTTIWWPWLSLRNYAMISSLIKVKGEVVDLNLIFHALGQLLAVNRRNYHLQ